MLPDDVTRLLRGAPAQDTTEQAFPFLTVDEHGYPHAALVSRAEVEPAADGSVLYAALASRRTAANLERSGTAALLAVSGTVCHHVKLKVVHARRADGLLGVVLSAVEHKADSLGIPLQPMGFQSTAEVAELENHARTAALLDALAHIPGGP